MWKPWIFVALGTALYLNQVSGQAYVEPTNVPSGYFDIDANSTCKTEIEKACGGQPAKQQKSTVIVDKKSSYQGSGNDKTDLVNALKSAINSLATPLPPNFYSLCSNVVASVEQDIQATTIDGVDGLLASWNLPSQVSSFLANIKFSEDVSYQTYRFSIQTGETKLQEFIASGKNNGEQVILAYMKVETSGSPIQQYVETRHCKSSWLVFKKCNTVYNPRGFTTDEIMSIQNGLLFHGYNKLLNEVDSLNTLLAVSMETVESTTHLLQASTEAEQLNWLEKAIISSYKQLKEQFDVQTQSEVVKKITNLGFNTFSEDAEIKYIKNMDGRYFDAFSQNLVNGLDIDEETRKKVKEYMFMVPFTEIGQWNMMRTMFNVNQVSNANYLCLMTYINEDNKYSIYTVQMKNSFEIAPDILIVRDSKSSWGGLFKESTERIERIPHAMTPTDLQQMLDYFDLVAFDRFMKLFNKNTLFLN